MTCIVAVVDNGIVYMGSDSMVTVGDYLASSMVGGKVFTCGDMLMGMAGAPKMCYDLRYNLVPPKREPGSTGDDREYIISAVGTAIKDILADEDTYTGDDAAGFEVLIGYHGALYTMYGYFDVFQLTKPYASIGSGSMFAWGALYTMESHGKFRRLSSRDTPNSVVINALEAAAEFSPTVRGPFSIDQL